VRAKSSDSSSESSKMEKRAAAKYGPTSKGKKERAVTENFRTTTSSSGANENPLIEHEHISSVKKDWVASANSDNKRPPSSSATHENPHSRDAGREHTSFGKKDRASESFLPTTNSSGTNENPHSRNIEHEDTSFIKKASESFQPTTISSGTNKSSHSPNAEHEYSSGKTSENLRPTTSNIGTKAISYSRDTEHHYTPQESLVNGDRKNERKEIGEDTANGRSNLQVTNHINSGKTSFLNEVSYDGTRPPTINAQLSITPPSFNSLSSSLLGR
jgi:hypothetical protein